MVCWMYCLYILQIQYVIKDSAFSLSLPMSSFLKIGVAVTTQDEDSVATGVRGRRCTECAERVWDLCVEA